MKFILLSLFLFHALLGVSQNSCYGPKGFDATYYYKDSSDNYWLGTGSSGGIFLKSKNNIWLPKNEPFGPAHISWIGNFQNKLITIADGDYYQYDYENEKWTKIKNIATIAEIFILKEKLKRENLEQLINNETYKNIKTPLQYNYIFIGLFDTLIICSNFGLYEYYLKNGKISKLKSDLVASDVYQIEKFGDAIYCLTNDYKIWKFRKNKWSEIFSIQNYLTDSLFYQKPSFDSLKNYDRNGIYKNGFISIYNDTLLYTINKNIYKINTNNSLVEKITATSDLGLIESYYKNDKVHAVQLISVEMNYIKYRILKYVNNIWSENENIFSSNSLPIYNSNQNSLRTNLVAFYKNFKLKLNVKDNLFISKNKINEKILSYFFDDDFLYLGTSGSGLIKIKNKKN